MSSSASIQNMLPAVLSVANEEQSSFFSPRVYTSQYNVVSSLLKSALVKSYPSNPMVLDQLDPFVKIAILPVTDGYVNLPPDYRDLLGSPYIFVNKANDCECGQEFNEPLTVQNFKTQTLKGGCSLNALIIYPESEFILRVNSTYNAPTWENPIGFMSGKKQIKVCPFNIGKVAVMYVVEDVQYNYGYIVQPDDTFLFDLSTTIEAPWGSNVFGEIFQAMCSLYSVYAKDQEMQGWAQVLNKIGLF